MTVVRKDVILWRLRFRLRQICIPRNGPRFLLGSDMRNVKGLAATVESRRLKVMTKLKVNSSELR
jgi:hypothetical protein